MSNTSIQRAKVKPLDSREKYRQLRAKPVASRKTIGGRVRSKKGMSAAAPEGENPSIARETSEETSERRNPRHTAP